MDEKKPFHWRVDATWAQAEESLLQVAPTARIESRADLRHRLRADGDPRFTLLRFQFAGELDAHSDPDDTITVTSVRAGWMHWTIGRDRGTSALPWMQSSDRRTAGRFGALDEVAVFLRRTPLLDLARAFYGEEDIRLDFDGPLPVDEQHGRFFAATLDGAHTLASSPAFEQPLLRMSLYRYIAVALLEGYRLTGDRRARTITAEGRLRRYRSAVQFLDDHASLPITVEDAARHVATSTADLEAIFRAHSLQGDGVRAHLRRARLAAAHTDLVDGDPTRGDTVRDIAYRWGWASPSLFARHYHLAYGINPRWVLDR